MAIRTYIPQITKVLKWLKKYITKNREKLIEHMGEGLFNVIELVLDLVEIVLAMIAANSDALKNFGDPIDTDSSAVINEVTAAFNAYIERTGS